MPQSIVEKFQHSPYHKKNEDFGKNVHERNRPCINGEAVHIQGIVRKSLFVSQKSDTKEQNRPCKNSYMNFIICTKLLVYSFHTDYYTPGRMLNPLKSAEYSIIYIC